MTTSIGELIKGPVVSLDTDRATLEYSYSIIGTNSPEDALQLLIDTAPLTKTIEGIVLSKRTFRLEPDGSIFIGTVEYSKPGASSDGQQEPIPEGESSFQFETGGGQTHITTSLETIQSVRRPSTPQLTVIDFKNVIGFNGDNIEGVDIVTPVFNFSETHAIPDANVTGTYKAILFNATGKVNNATFKGFAAGEVLFLGASGSKRNDGPWEVTFRFAASQNVTGQTIGEITGINKKGWEYLWTYFKETTSQGANISSPEQVNVEKVYESTDFSLLGLGT